jgi:hypothetical protein
VYSSRCHVYVKKPMIQHDDGYKTPYVYICPSLSCRASCAVRCCAVLCGAVLCCADEAAVDPTPVFFFSHGSTMMLGEESESASYWESVGNEALRRGIKTIVMMGS